LAAGDAWPGRAAAIAAAAIAMAATIKAMNIAFVTAGHCFEFHIY